MITPRSDDAMQYDYTKHRYILKSEWVKNELGEDLLRILNADGDTNRSSLAERFLDRASRILYNYIYSKGKTKFKDWIEYLLATKEDYREPIKEALEEQVLYMLRNEDLTTYSGVDLFKLGKLEISRDDGVGRQAVDILENAGIIYAGDYGVLPNFEEIKRVGY